MGLLLVEHVQDLVRNVDLVLIDDLAIDAAEDRAAIVRVDLLAVITQHQANVVVPSERLDGLHDLLVRLVIDLRFPLEDFLLLQLGRNILVRDLLSQLGFQFLVFRTSRLEIVQLRTLLIHDFALLVHLRFEVFDLLLDRLGLLLEPLVVLEDMADIDQRHVHASRGGLRLLRGSGGGDRDSRHERQGDQRANLHLQCTPCNVSFGDLARRGR